MMLRISRRSLSRFGTRSVAVGANYGKYAFYDAKRASPNVQRVLAEVQSGAPVSDDTTDAIASELLDWSLANGVTHYCHWFQPLTGLTAEKHDTFLDINRDGEPIQRFRGKDLKMGEPDGSSFPSGGLRNTHVARGYTVWDPSSSPFILNHDVGATLYIPSGFFSWDGGRSLDNKLPLLRSSHAVNQAGVRLFNQVLGQSDVTTLHCDGGFEQEFFLVDADLFNRRIDLQLTGRTVVGAFCAKGQVLADSYFGHVSDRVLNLMEAVQEELWALGIPVQTRHREVAPGQYEFAPRFAPVAQGVDRNLIMMEVMKKVSRKHGMECLLHEKPYAGVNGSGKHNNWSFGTNLQSSLLDPGSNPSQDTQFMLSLAMVLQAVDKNQELLRYTVAGAGNDHRLGANEAPPAIVSAFLGEDLSNACENFIAGKSEPLQEEAVELGVPFLPEVSRHCADRNRTSPFAFTGNKFEFRAVGSSHNPGRSSTVLNTILADAMNTASEEIGKAVDSGADPEAAARDYAMQLLKDHERIVFNGDNYSEDWVVEAERRGLANNRSTPAALQVLNQPETVDLFERTGVLSPEELEARYNVESDEYSNRIQIESRVMLQIAKANYDTTKSGAAQAVEAKVASLVGNSDCQANEELIGVMTTLREEVDERDARGEIDLPGYSDIFAQQH